MFIKYKVYELKYKSRHDNLVAKENIYIMTIKYMIL